MEVCFEVAPDGGFAPAGTHQIAGRVRDAVRPAVDAAREVLGRVAEVGPHEVQLKFGIKVNGEANWLIAKAATEASFEVTLTWRPDGDAGVNDAAAT